MTTRDLAVVGIRLIALYLIARGIVVVAQSTPYFFAGEQVGGQPMLYATVALQLVAPLVLGVLMWVSAPWLSSLMVRGRAAELSMDGLSAESIAAVAFGVAGVVILVYSLPQLIASVFTAWEMSRQIGAASNSQWLQPAALAARCLLAVGVAVGARSMACWVLKLRTLGLHRDDR